MAIRQYHFTIRLPRKYTKIINYLKPLQGNEWDCKVSELRKKKYGTGARRDELKGLIRTHLEKRQGHHCAFCGLDLRTRGAQIEHIAPKAARLYPQFMWESKNLILACPLCNGFTKKSTYDSIDILDAQYRNCTFKIVHPYFDDPNMHFEYVTHPNTGLAFLIKARLIKGVPSAQGAKSIELFGLKEPEMTEERYKDALANSLPVPNFDALIQEVTNKGYVS
ncbi:HNH endonuclease family protein [Flavobacterium inviolabile]|uniref:hypothetical protein n=1 Tax=Flavobacterium inviolabile TaxID=2748320 RepID=UPI0015AD6BA1|nr:hypothetical protein [Flavobacterium inviolabile]